MILKFERNGRMWMNEKNTKKEEVLDIFKDGETKRHYKGMCNESFVNLTGIDLKEGESVLLEIKKCG
jgi:protein-L-isoaspartate O-methyltransferase